MPNMMNGKKRRVLRILFFYLFPVFVVPLGMFAWRSTNELIENEYRVVDWSQVHSQFTSFDIYQQIY
jgi:hypothetical protein